MSLQVGIQVKFVMMQYNRSIDKYSRKPEEVIKEMPLCKPPVIIENRSTWHESNINFTYR